MNRHQGGTRPLGFRTALAAATCLARRIAIGLGLGVGCLMVLTTASVFGQASDPATASPAATETPAGSAERPPQAVLLTRSTLTGDWGGVRSSLANQGMVLDLRYTGFYQGLSSGTGDQGYDYGGKVDAFINLDSARMGLWDGGGFRSHLEYRHGSAPANLGGAIFAVNTALYWPVDTPNELVATSLYVTQKLGDRNSIAIGKFNPVDLLAADPFYGGWGIDRFMSLIFAAPPSGLVPVVFMGAVASLKTEPIHWTLMVFDPKDRTNDYLPGDLFKTGVTISVGGAHTGTLAGRQTSVAVTGLYSTAEGTDYSSLPPGSGTTNKKGSYNISFEFKHNLQQSALQPNAGWGFYLKMATADGNPNYVQSSVIAGVGGRALFLGRPQDSFGVGAFRYKLSDVLQNALSPNTKFRDEVGIDVFYNHAVTPWLWVGADIQYIKPAAGSFKNALVSALRTQIRF